MPQMPIWALTAERLEKLKEAIRKKKEEHDELQALSEKDLWCRDLDEFMVEWEKQMAIDAEIQTNIRRMGRRVSKKIGAGRGRKAKDDDEYEPDKKSKGKAKAAVKVETKSAQRFAEMFGATSKPAKKEKEPQVNLKEESDNFSDDDFAALSRSKPAAKPAAARPASQSLSLSQSEEPENPRTNKRAAASKARAFIEEDSDSDDVMLDDVGALVKGIGKPAGDSSGRYSLHAMSRPESSQGLPKVKSKASRTFDLDSPDETNYEMLAKSSPHKTATKEDMVDEFLSDDEPAPAPVKVPAGLSQVKKARGRPAGSKNKGKDEPKPKAAVKASAKTTTLSPAAKAYAAKKAGKATALESSDDEMGEPDSPVAKPAARRPGRAAASRRPIVVDEDSSLMMDEQDESEDPFEVDDDDD